MNAGQLEAIYRGAIDDCAPQRLIAQHLARHRTGPCSANAIVALGKCAAGMLDGARGVLGSRPSFAAIPAGYPLPSSDAGLDVAIGGHPSMTSSSFAAGRALLAFVERHRDQRILFLISGGASACVEWPLAPWFNERELITVNDSLVASALPIASINSVRKHLSAIKGGRLVSHVAASETLIYSDVSTGAAADVGSGPTMTDFTTNRDAANVLRTIAEERHKETIAKLEDRMLPETIKARDEGHTADVVADNVTLVDAAVARAQQLGYSVRRWNGQLDHDVAQSAEELVKVAEELKEGELLVAGGEPTTARTGNGRGGRCSELAVRFALAARTGSQRAMALFGSSDGVDGSSETAGVILDGDWPERLDPDEARAALAISDSISIAIKIGRPLIIRPTGNNLRDLFLVARG
jgi:glycerate-2-kinase